MSVHNKLKDFKKWVDIDITDNDMHNEISKNIENDLDKLTPEILDNLSKYDKYLDYMSNLGKSQMSVIRMEKLLSKSFLTAFAVIKFKNLLKKKNYK